MKRVNSTKVITFISIILFSFQITLSAASLAEQQTVETTTTSSEQQDSSRSESSSSVKDLSESTTVQNDISNQSNQSTESLGDNQRNQQSAQNAISTIAEAPLDSNDLSQWLLVRDWWIFGDSFYDPLSATTAASVKTDYNLRFVWSLTKEDNQFIKPGEYFCIDLPENIGDLAEGIEGWGFWTTSTTASHKTRLEVQVDGETYDLGEWWIDWREDGSPRGKYYVKVEFGDGVIAASANQIEGIQFDLPARTLKNMTLKGGIQEVIFGGVKKRIKFEQAKEIHSEGDDYKYASKTGSNTITFDVGIGRMTLNELTGDVVNYAVNSEKGFYLDGDYHGYRWGENLTNLNDIYLEDTLNPGVVVSSLSLSALVQAPIGLTEENRVLQSGGLINRDVATFESYLFADYGNGPIYRSAGSNQEIQFPKQEHSYQVIVQEKDESLESFRTRVKANPQQYGIFTAGSGKNAQRTICINIGDIHKDASVQPKYSELTDQVYPVSERKITRIKGAVLAGQSEIKIPQFAVEAANNTIKHGFYPESARELLEDYYTLTYGDGNIINGQTSAFNISMTLSYPLDGNLTEKKDNTAFAYYENAKQQKDPNFEQPGLLTGTGQMTNPYGKIVINPRTLALVKYDGDTYKEMNGVEFDLQKKENNSWVTVKTAETAEFITAEGEKIQGVIQVSGLTNGTYRFVEKSGGENIYPEGYDQTKSSDWNTSEQRIVSDELLVDGQKMNAPAMIENIPLALAPYVVEHYFLKDGCSPDSIDPADFELRFVENETGEEKRPVGSTFTGVPRSHLSGYTYKKVIALEKASGTITAITNPNLSYQENGQLVLRFYYVQDDDAIPFTITKLNGAGETMPSYDEQGNALDTEVSFYVYEFNWESGKGPGDVGAEPTKGESNQYWKLVENDSDSRPLQQPIKTDSQGRLRAKIDLVEDVLEETGKTLAIVEATNTYPNYEAPSVEQTWWIIWTGHKGANETPPGRIAGCTDMGSDLDEAKHESSILPDNSCQISLINRASKGQMKIYKADQDKNMMPSDSKKKVEFDFYKYIGQWTDSDNPTTRPLSDDTSWEYIGRYQTDAEGKILDYNLDSVETYALKERTTYPSFSVPIGFWVLWTSKVTEGIINHGVQYVQGDNDDPGVLPYNDTNNPIGSTVLLNKEVKQEFSFIKENERAEPLGEVEFAIYSGKEEEELKIGENDDPNLANTYWNMSQPVKVAISAAAGSNKGKVTFNLVAGTYLLVETKTAFGYQLPQGQWILTIDPLEPDSNQRIKIQARGSSLPPAFYKKEGVYHLPNIKEYHLPSSGAGGVLLYVVLGIALIGAAVLVNQSKKTDKKKAD